VGSDDPSGTGRARLIAEHPGAIEESERLIVAVTPVERREE